MSPGERTIAALQADGWAVRRVEHWILGMAPCYCRRPAKCPCKRPHGLKRKDVWGADIQAKKDGQGYTLHVQVTDGAHLAEHVADAIASPDVFLCLRTGDRFEVWGWRTVAMTRKDGSKGKAKRWKPRVVPNVMSKDGPVALHGGGDE